VGSVFFWKKNSKSILDFIAFCRHVLPVRPAKFFTNFVSKFTLLKIEAEKWVLRDAPGALRHTVKPLSRRERRGEPYSQGWRGRVSGGQAARALAAGMAHRIAIVVKPNLWRIPP
jgi:hypothetical protein